MTRSYSLIRAAVLLAALPLAGHAWDFSDGSKLTLENDYLYSHNRVTGSSRDSSYLTQGRRFTHNLSSAYTARKLGIDWEAGADGRLADDSRVEVRRGSLKRAYLKASTSWMSLTAGDFLASFTDRTLNKGLKGGQVTLKPFSFLELTAAGGFDKNSWDELYITDLTESLDRVVQGARAVAHFPGDSRLGVNAVIVRDRRARFDFVTTELNQNIYSADWALPTVWGLKLYGETAHAYARSNIPSYDENGESNNIDAKQKGWNHFVHGDFTLGRFTSNSEFERVSPEYLTSVGAAASDRIRGQTSNTYNLVGPWKWIVLNYTWFHDNLNHAEGVNTSTTRMPETGFRFDGPEWRPTLWLEAKLRHREVTDTLDGKKSRTRSVVSSFSDRVGPITLSIDYEFQHEDASDLSFSKRHHILGAGANSTIETKSGWKFTEGVRWDLQRDRDNLLVQTDQTDMTAMTGQIDMPWGVEMAGGYTRTVVKPVATLGSDRRAYSASFAYSLLKNPDRKATVRYRQNDNRFVQLERDFKETVWEIGLRIAL